MIGRAVAELGRIDIVAQFAGVIQVAAAAQDAVRAPSWASAASSEVAGH